MATTNVTHVTDDNQKPFDDVESTGSANTVDNTEVSSSNSDNKVEIELMAGSVQGWQDFADLTTQSTPIEQTSVDGASVQLTTDNAGTLTDGNTTSNYLTTLSGVNDIWNTTSNTIQFGGTGIKTNDTIDARIHFEISPNVVPQNFDLIFEFYDDVDGGGNKVFELESSVQSVFENAGTFVERLIERRFFIGESIKDGSAIVKLKGSSAFEVKMKGFNFEIRR